MLKEKGVIAHYILASVVNITSSLTSRKTIQNTTQTNNQQDTKTQHGDSTSQQWASFGFSSRTLLDTLQLAPPFAAPALRAQKSYWLHPMP
jgi:type IV secretory pathway VirB10-like protein